MSTASPYVSSIQPFAITIASGNTTGSTTLSPAVSSNAFILWNGETAGDTTGAFKFADSTVTLTSSVTVTATRSTSTTTTATIYGVVIDGTSSLISSVQYGTIAIAAVASTGTATITSVPTGSSAVFFLGTNSSTAAGGSPKTTCPIVTLTNSTTVTATLGSSNALGANVAFCVVSFQPSVINSLQAITTTSAVSQVTDTQTITSVVPANAIVAYGGTNTVSTTPNPAYFYASLASATSLAFTANTASTNTRTHAATVIEFVSGIVKVQRGVVNIASTGATATATISAVDTAVSALNFTGYNTSQTADDEATGYVYAALTNATTVTAGMNTAGSTNVAGYEVISFLLGTVGINESGNAVDTVGASWHTSGSVTEGGAASDASGASAHYFTGVTEAGSATDTAALPVIIAGNVSEVGNAVDTLGFVFIPANPLPILGSQADMLGRILTNLPRGWLPSYSITTSIFSVAPLWAGLLSGPAAAFSWVYDLLVYSQAQLRIATATNFNLDIISLDYFGQNLPRRPGESDASFSSRIRQNLFIPRGTRAAVSNAVYNLTGSYPKIVEPGNPTDCGGYGSISTPHVWYGTAYCDAGAYGSLNTPYQFFVTTGGAAASVNPVANVNGYSCYNSGYANINNVGTVNYGWNEYVSGAQETGEVTDAEIYSTIAQNVPAGVIGWVALT